MSDLVTRLRSHQRIVSVFETNLGLRWEEEPDPLAQEAADEIEALRFEFAKMKSREGDDV